MWHESKNMKLAMRGKRETGCSPEGCAGPAVGLVSVNLHRCKRKVKTVRREGAAVGTETVPEAVGLLFLDFR